MTKAPIIFSKETKNIEQNKAFFVEYNFMIV
jgi:hypothetical protein